MLIVPCLFPLDCPSQSRDHPPPPQPHAHATPPPPTTPCLCPLDCPSQSREHPPSRKPQAEDFLVQLRSSFHPLFTTFYNFSHLPIVMAHACSLKRAVLLEYRCRACRTGCFSLGGRI